MHLTLRFFANFRVFEEKTTVGEVLDAVEAEFPDLEGELREEDGSVPEFVRVLRNGRAVVHGDGVDTVLEDGDTLSVFPPVAGGSEGEADRAETVVHEESYRGISARLALGYLENLGGDRLTDETVGTDHWRVTVTEDDPVRIGPSLTMTPVKVRFEAAPGRVDDLIERFERKAMRAGG